jgi:lactoylglutathione lyase
MSVAARLGWVVLYVDDIEVSSAFYEGVFGLERTVDWEGYREYDTGPTKFGLLDRVQARTHVPAADGGSRASQISFTVALETVDQTYLAAVAAGGVGMVEPDDKPWGQRVGFVADPDDHLIEIGSPLAET